MPIEHVALGIACYSSGNYLDRCVIPQRTTCLGKGTAIPVT